MTKRDMFVEIANTLEQFEGTEAMVEFIDHEVELIDKRKSAPRKPTAEQLKNEAVKAGMLENLPAEGATATEIAVANDISVQKATALLRQLVLVGKVERVEGKGKEKARFLPV